MSPFTEAQKGKDKIISFILCWVVMSVWKMPSSTFYTELTRIWTREVARSGSSSWTIGVPSILSSPFYCRKNSSECEWTPAWLLGFPANSPTDHNMSGWRTSGLTLWSAALELFRGLCCPPSSSLHTQRTSATTLIRVTSRGSQMTRPSWGVSKMMKRRNTGAWWGTLLSDATQITCSSTP